MVIVTVLLSAVFDAWSHNWVLTIISAITVVLFVETFAIYFHNHPKTWRTIRIILFLILIAMLFIGAVRAY